MGVKKKRNVAPMHPNGIGDGLTYLVEKEPSNGADILVADWRRGILPSAKGTQVIGSLDEIATRRGGFEVYRKLFDEVDVVKACLTLKVAAIVPGYSIEAMNPNDARAVEVAEALAEDFEALSGSFERTLSELVTSSLVMGFGLGVKTWHLDGPRIRLAAVRPVNVSGIDFVCDSANRVHGIRQTRAGNIVEDIDPRHVVHLTHGGLTHNDPFGTSDLKSAWRLCWQRENIMAWLMTFLERYAEPAAVAKIPVHYPESKQNAALEALRRIQPKTAITVPSDVELSYLTAQTDPRVMYLSAIDALDVRIARSLLMPDRLGFSGRAEESGSYALADVQSRLWFIAIENARKHVEQVINETLIKDCVGFGWGDNYAKVRFKLAPLTPEDRAATVAQWVQLVSAGVVNSGDEDEKRLRKLLSMPVEAGTRAEAFTERRRVGGGAPGGAASTSSALPHLKEGPGNRGDAPRHRSSAAAPVLPSSFAEKEPPRAWRELTPAEARADVLAMMAEADDAVRELAASLVQGTETIVGDLKDTVANGGELTAEKVNALALNPKLVEAVRARVEDQLFATYTKARLRARREIEAAKRVTDDGGADG